MAVGQGESVLPVKRGNMTGKLRLAEINQVDTGPEDEFLVGHGDLLKPW